MKGLNGIIIRVSGVRVPPPLLVPDVASGRTTPLKSATGRDLGGFVCARLRSAASQRLARSGRVSSPARCIWRCTVEDVTDGGRGSDLAVTAPELNAGAEVGRLGQPPTIGGGRCYERSHLGRGSAKSTVAGHKWSMQSGNRKSKKNKNGSTSRPSCHMAVASGSSWLL